MTKPLGRTCWRKRWMNSSAERVQNLIWPVAEERYLKVTRSFSRLTRRRLLMAKLLYGAGLRLMECLRLRVKDVDFGNHQIIVRDGKGEKDWATVLPESLIPALQIHISDVKALHQKDLRDGYGEVSLP